MNNISTASAIPAKAPIIPGSFFFFSNFIISVGLNSSYKKMSSTSNVNTPRGVEITEAESTLVNGKIKGKIKYDEEQDIEGKYLRMDFLSKR